MQHLSKLVIAASVLATSGGVLGGTDTDTLLVTATVPATCSVGAGTLDFGEIDPTVQNFAESTITVSCTALTFYTVGLDGGSNPGTTPFGFPFRRMGTAGSTIGYDLFTDPDHQNPWGDEGVGDTYERPPLETFGTVQDIPVYGVTEPLVSVNVSTGSYQDDVFVTVDF